MEWGAFYASNHLSNKVIMKLLIRQGTQLPAAEWAGEGQGGRRHVDVDAIHDGSGPHLHPVGQPVALGVGALHREEDVAPRDDAALRHRLDLDGQVAVVFLPTEEEEEEERSVRRLKGRGRKKQRKRLLSVKPGPDMHFCRRQYAPISLAVTHHQSGNVDFAPA